MINQGDQDLWPANCHCSQAPQGWWGIICIHCGEERTFTSRRWRSEIPKTEVMRAQVRTIWRVEGMDFGKLQNSFWNIAISTYSKTADMSRSLRKMIDRYARASCVIYVNNMCPNWKALNDSFDFLIHFISVCRPWSVALGTFLRGKQLVGSWQWQKGGGGKKPRGFSKSFNFSLSVSANGGKRICLVCQTPRDSLC